MLNRSGEELFFFGVELLSSNPLLGQVKSKKSKAKERCARAWFPIWAHSHFLMTDVCVARGVHSFFLSLGSD